MPLIFFRKPLAPVVIAAIAALALTRGAHIAYAQNAAPPTEANTPNKPLPIIKQPSGLFHGSLVNAAKTQTGDPLWQRANKEVYITVRELDIQKTIERERKLFLPALRRGRADDKTVTLTFDDGPHPDFTPKLLEILRKENVKATFFVIGFMVEKYPELAKAIHDGGHLLASHTFSHVNLTTIKPEEVGTELIAADEIIRRATGKPTRFYRPPGGRYNDDVIAAGTALGMTAALWTDDPADFANPGDQIIVDRTLKDLSNGGIILMHDGAPETLEILPGLIQTIKKRGYSFVRVDEMYDQFYRPKSAAAPFAGLVNTQWQFKEIAYAEGKSLTPQPGEKLTLEFDANGKVTGAAGVNRFTGSYKAGADGSLAFGPLAMTRAANPLGSVADAYAKELAQAIRFLYDGETLILQLPGDTGLMKFRRMTP